MCAMRRVCGVCVVVAFSAAGAAEQDAPVTEPPSIEAMDEAQAAAILDDGIENRRLDELLPLVKKAIQTEHRPTLQWRLAQASMGYYESRRDLPDAVKLAGYSSIEKLMSECMAQKGPPHCELFYGAALGRAGTVRGILSSLRALKPIESTWLRGLQRCAGHPEYQLERSPLEAYYYYALGALYRLLPDWWIIKLISGVRGDLDKAIALQRKSLAMRRDPSTVLELGVTLVCSGHRRDIAAHLEEGKQLLQVVLTMPTHDKLDDLDHRAAAYLLRNPRAACGYSRDKMQDLGATPKE
jgi:hypothetical protein